MEKSRWERFRDDPAIWIGSAILLVVLPMIYRVVGIFLLSFEGDPEAFRATITNAQIFAGIASLISGAMAFLKEKLDFILAIILIADLLVVAPIIVVFLGFLSLSFR